MTTERDFFKKSYLRDIGDPADEHLRNALIEIFDLRMAVARHKAECAVAFAKAIESAAMMCEHPSFALDINRKVWKGAAKKEVIAKTCQECAAAIRTIKPMKTRY